MSDDLPSVIEFSEDISDAEAPPPLPVQEYEANIRGVTQKTSATSGNSYAEISFHIDTDQFPADYDVENAPDGKTIVHRRVTLVDDRAGRYRLRLFMEAIGATPGRNVDLNDWIGLSARVLVAHSEYEGVTREEITKVTSLD